MLPILNMKNKEKTLHASEALTFDDIRKHKVKYTGRQGA
jgi:hypothetical protein